MRGMARRTGIIGAGLLVAASTAWAKPQLTVTLATSREVIEIKNGVTTVKMVPTKTAVSGEILHYTLTYINNGNEPATNAVIDNPIPKGTFYVANSATGAHSEITFSTDGGETYAPPARLTYELKRPSGKTEKRMATAADYTNIRWNVKRVAPTTSGTTRFAVQIK